MTMNTTEHSWMVPRTRWEPPGSFDQETGVWIVDDDVHNRFPESGVDVFHGVDDESFWFAHRNRMIEEALRRHSPDRSLLEVGSGSGVVASHLGTHGYAVAAVEPILRGATMASERGIEVSFCGDLHSLALPSHSVHNVGLFDVIEHLEDPRELLLESHRILRPGGLLLVTVPAHMWLWSAFDDWNGHQRRYNRNGLIADLEALGFEPVWCSYFFGPLVLPALFRRLRSQTTNEDVDDVEVRLGDELAPSPLVNRVLGAVLAPERHLVGRWRIPTGSSIAFVGRREGG